MSKPTTPAKLSFKKLNKLNKNDISAILLRYNELVNLYKTKLDEVSGKCNDKTTGEDFKKLVNDLLDWSAMTKQLDPFIGKYETKDVLWRLGKYEKALEYFEKSFNNLKVTLPENHPYI